MFKPVLTLYLFSFSLFAQTHIPESLKTKNNDLRTNKVLFSIKSLKKKTESYSFSVANNEQHIISYDAGQSQQRIATGKSEKIDKKFVSEFIKMKYAMKERGDVPCYKEYELDMRGESQTICAHEINKIKIVKTFIAELESLKK